MKKFKVIEESRFLNKQNLKQIVGGKCIGDTNFTICEPGAQLAGGFSTNPMCPGQLRWGTCDIGWDYQGAGACFNNFVTEPCSAKKQYIGPIAPHWVKYFLGRGMLLSLKFRKLTNYIL